MENSEYASGIEWLTAGEGETVLREASLLPNDRLTRLTRLRRKYSAELATVAVEQLELRHKARRKFAQADRMFFTPEGLEQSTGDRIAAWRAAQFGLAVGGGRILDCCCGIGGDAIALAQIAPVLAVDLNPAALACVRANAAALRPTHSIETLCADVTSLDYAALREAGVVAAFYDPSRRTDADDGTRRRIRSGDEYAPPLAFFAELCASFPFAAVKVSPMLDDETLQRYGGWVEFVSDNGECKEADIWHGIMERRIAARAASEDERVVNPAIAYFPTGDDRYVGTVLSAAQNAPAFPTATSVFYAGEGDPLAISPPLAWLHEPDPALIRSHRADAAAGPNAFRLDSQVAYLTSAEPLHTPGGTNYRILHTMPFHLRQIETWLRAENRHVVTVKKRHVAIEPEALIRKFKRLCPDGLPTTLVLCPHGGGTVALLGELA